MIKIIATFISLIVFSVAIIGGIGYLVETTRDTTHIVSIEQKAANGDTQNATKEIGEFANEKAQDAADDAVTSVYIALILRIVVIVGSAISAIVIFISKFF